MHQFTFRRRALERNLNLQRAFLSGGWKKLNRPVAKKSKAWATSSSPPRDLGSGPEEGVGVLREGGRRETERERDTERDREPERPRDRHRQETRESQRYRDRDRDRDREGGRGGKQWRSAAAGRYLVTSSTGRWRWGCGECPSFRDYFFSRN